MINDSYVTQNMIANLLPASQLKVQFACTLLVSRGGSRISGKGVHMCVGLRGGGGSLLILSQFS